MTDQESDLSPEELEIYLSLKRELEAQIEKEIEEHLKEDRCEGYFLRSEYREHRLNGKTREQLEKDYDLCHVFR